MSDKSVNPPGFFSLQHGSYCDIGRDLLSEIETSQPRPEAKASLEWFVAITIVADFCFLTVVFDLSLHFFESVSFKTFHVYTQFFGTLVLTLVTISILYIAKFYRIETIARFRFFCTRFFVLLSVLLIASSIGYSIILTQVPVPGALAHSFCEWSFVAIIAFMAIHWAISEAFRLLTLSGIIRHNVVVVGVCEAAEHFINVLHTNGFGARVNAVFQDGPVAGSIASLAGAVVKGGIPDLLRYAKYHPIHTVVIAKESKDPDSLHALVEQLCVQPLRIRVLQTSLIHDRSVKGTPFAWCAGPGELPGVKLIRLADRPIDGLGCLIKSLLDLSVTCVALLLFGPLMMICAMGIKLTSPGPILFRQRRIGYRNKEFDVFKFRTMHRADCNTGQLTVRNDPRLFKFGEIMRRFSFDELPQLFNVLRGDMSLVGPRPHMPEAKAAGILYYDAVANYAARHRVKPGITGWAQISGWRGPTENLEQIENRVEHDLFYIDNWSLAFDIKILFKTMLVGFFGDNAF